MKWTNINSKHIVMFLGRIHWIKGLDLLVESFHEMTKSRDDAILVIVGNDDGALSPGEVLGLAGLSGTHYLELEPWRTDANDDDKVNFKDYSIMANNWLKEILWPAL